MADYEDAGEEMPMEDIDIGVDEAVVEEESKQRDDPLAALLKHHPECIIAYAENAEQGPESSLRSLSYTIREN